MSNRFFLEENDIEVLINLLLRSQQSRTREALCFSIGIDPKRLSFIRDSSEYDFFLLLIRYLNEIGEQEALCKLCCKELLPVFHHGQYAPILSEIAAKLNCNQRLSQNSSNNKQPTVPSSIPASRISVNPFYQLAKNKLIIGGTILMIGLAGFSLSKYSSNSSNHQPLTQPTVYYNRGLADYNRGDYNSAIANYTQTISFDAKYTNAYYYRGLSYYNLRDYNSAITNYSQAISLDAKYTNAYYYRGLSYYNLRDYNSAITNYTQTILLDANNSKAYYYRGLSYYNLRDYNSAITNYTQTILLDANNSKAYFKRGLAYYNNGNKDKAVQDFNKVVELNNDIELSQTAKQKLQKLGTK